MAKAPDAFRTISEVAEWLGVQAHVLRFWESKFAQVKPVKRAGGRRYYRPADMALLGGIKTLLHDDGMTIKGVQKILKEQGVAAVTAKSRPVDLDADENATTDEPVEKVVPLKQPRKPSAQMDMFADVAATEEDHLPETSTAEVLEAAEQSEPVEEVLDAAAEDDLADSSVDAPEPVAETQTPEPAEEAPSPPTALPLPSADTPVLEALRQLVPGQVPAIKLRSIYDQMVLLRDRMDDAAKAG
ncbi:MAG: MerR family transcriptional regulator [Pseudomonadota bacterium]